MLSTIFLIIYYTLLLIAFGLIAFGVWFTIWFFRKEAQYKREDAESLDAWNKMTSEERKASGRANRFC
jgi:hypothetical protein